MFPSCPICTGKLSSHFDTIGLRHSHSHSLSFSPSYTGHVLRSRNCLEKSFVRTKPRRSFTATDSARAWAGAILTANHSPLPPFKHLSTRPKVVQYCTVEAPGPLSESLSPHLSDYLAVIASISALHSVSLFARLEPVLLITYF